MSTFNVALLTVILLLLNGCSKIAHIEISNLSALPSNPTPTAMAGVSVVDLTPPAGMPKNGYSINTSKGEGYRTRIKARIFYLKDAKGESVALVQTDLLSGTLILQHVVAEKVAKHTDIDASRLMIGGTHSHSAPGNIYGNDHFNAGAGRGRGFSTEYLDFVSEQISQGIIKAYQQQRPARVATGKRDIYGFNRNRSITSYVQNEGMEDLDVNDPDLIYKAVNPSLYMLRVDALDEDGQYKPLGAFSSFSVHATAISEPNDLYDADVFAYMHRDVEWRIEEKYKTSWTVAHGMINGTQGDMAPNLPLVGDRLFSQFPVDFPATKKLGQGIAAEAWTLFESLGSELTADLSLRSSMRSINIREHNTVEDVVLCKDPAIGTSMVGGAFERRTPIISALPFIKAGSSGSKIWWFGKDGCQGNKRILAGRFLQNLVVPRDAFPDTVLFQLLQINDLVIAPLPFEITVESGRRMTKRILAEYKKAGDDSAKHVMVSSVANGLHGYSTTPEEYSYQTYEGGHTLYGKNSTPYLSAQLGVLASDMLRSDQRIAELPKEWHYDLKQGSFYPEAASANGSRALLEAPEKQWAESSHDENYWQFSWLDVPLAEIEFHRPLIHVEESDDGKVWRALVKQGEPISDEGYDISVHYLDDANGGGMGEYAARWYNPGTSTGKKYRFVVAERTGQKVLYSTVF